MEDLVVKIEEKKIKLAEKQAPIKKLVEEYEKTKKEINKDLLKKVYAYFEKGSNDSVCFLFEALVGIMRNLKLADSSAVEMYLKKIEGLQIGLSRIDFKKVS